MTSIELFDYNLPKELIAQEPVEPRDSSRLLILGRASGEIEHRHFYDIVDELRPGDLLIMNNSKVFKARLQARQGETEFEVFLLRPVDTVWQTLIKKSKKLKVGDKLDFGGCEAVIINKEDDGVVELDFHLEPSDVFKLAEEKGAVPLPPYIAANSVNSQKYQTIYAEHVGSVAAPTAGFHFTPELLDKLKAKGVETAFVTLHVGLGTFRPIKTLTLEEHKMHSEFYEIPAITAEKIKKAMRRIAVGTTTTRALESAYATETPKLAGETNLFITPGYEFKAIDAMITNFHLPKSSLLVMVSAFAGRENVLAAYRAAVEEKYRFYSFGDAMFVR